MVNIGSQNMWSSGGGGGGGNAKSVCRKISAKMPKLSNSM